MDLFARIQKTIADAKKLKELEKETSAVEAAANKLGEVVLHLGAIAESPKVLNAFAFAYPFMEAAGDVIMAWMLLWRAVIAAKALKNAPRKKDAAFYEGQLKSTEFFTQSILPVTLGKMNAILTTNNAAVEISEASFGG